MTNKNDILFATIQVQIDQLQKSIMELEKHLKKQGFKSTYNRYTAVGFDGRDLMYYDDMDTDIRPVEYEMEIVEMLECMKDSLVDLKDKQ